MKTRSIKQNEVNEKWYLVDAKGARLGKVAEKVAKLLIGKDDVNRVSYLQSKNKVIVINSKEVDFHPRKLIQKVYYRHTGYVGGLKEIELGELLSKKPNRVIELAIKGMLPKTKHRDPMVANLYIYEDAAHKHEAQKPHEIKVND